MSRILSSLLAWIMAIAIIVAIGGQIVYTFAKPKACEIGTTRNTDSSECDDWNPGTDGWWFQK